MKVTETTLRFQHIFIQRKIDLKKNWAEGLQHLENIVLANGLYVNGPMFFSIKEVEGESQYGEFEFFAPLNTEVEVMQKSSEDGFAFEEGFFIEKVLRLKTIVDDGDFQHLMKS